MSRALLQHVWEARALPHTLRYDQLADYHVPFDDLGGGTGVEHALAHWAGGQGRVALIGPPGAGKSSVVAWVLAHCVPDAVAALRIPVALADDDEVQTTAGFARHAIRRVVAQTRLDDDDARELRTRSADALTERGNERRRGGRLGVRLGGLTGELSRELMDSSAELQHQVGAGEVVEGLRRLIELFRARALEPLLILDDSDTWVARPHDEAPRALATGFFGRVVRMLITEIPCGFVLAVHPSYLSLPAYQEVAERLERVAVPQLPHPGDDLARIIDRRLEVAEIDGSVRDMLEPPALEELASLYRDVPDVRRALSIAATAIRLTLEDSDRAHVTAAAIRAAAAVLVEPPAR